VLANLVPDASVSTRLPFLAYINVPLTTYCKFAAASRGSPYDNTAFLLYVNEHPCSLRQYIIGALQLYILPFVVTIIMIT